MIEDCQIIEDCHKKNIANGFETKRENIAIYIFDNIYIRLPSRVYGNVLAVFLATKRGKEYDN